jgi:diacylglycerol kinase (CTP)
VVSILILSWADTAASTIGRLWGRYTRPLPRRLPYIGLQFAPRKSTAGYAAAFVTGALISSAFLGYHASVATFAGPSRFFSLPSFEELRNMDWDQLSALLKSLTNFHQSSVSHTPSSWSWNQRVGGGWPGLLVIGLWSGLVTAMAEAMGKSFELLFLGSMSLFKNSLIDVGDVDDNLTLPVLSGLGIWAYVGLLRWIDLRML